MGTTIFVEEFVPQAIGIIPQSHGDHYFRRGIRAPGLSPSGLWLKLDWKYTKFEFPTTNQLRESTSSLQQLYFREMSK